MSSIQKEITEELEDTQHGRFLTFAIGQEVFGIEIRHVTEIIGMQPITALPEVPDYIRGIINLRGKIIPVVDVRAKFKKEPVDYDDRTCIIVVDIKNICAGLIVDHVAEVLTIDDENIADPPDNRTGIENKFIRGIGKVEDDIKLLLDCEKLFDEEKLK